MDFVGDEVGYLTIARAFNSILLIPYRKGD